ncbi:hypothetical protein [Bradyrhizobium erythrophlei]|uniref:Uncharacterized protein n=1 Tax=Bradyrhizobium erythrophlei TaxID=1437360 RepID=A0A1H4ZQ96_9BRAD|nr:hypothetical protein [Bradyrhizobium erythrophlei]SED32167.1 hypothetical protein SAMN05444164_4433 [Bradyrhizobium erythrophlei]
MSESPHSAIAARPRRATARVLVGVLVAPDAASIAMPETFARWRRLTPLATWLPIELRETGHAGILSGVAAALDRVGMTPRQLILLGEGPVARRMLELALRHELPCGGIVAIDVAADALPFRIVPTATAIRLVVHHTDEGPHGNLIGSLRAADLDARIINLDLAAGRGAEAAAASATETFVLELVATIGRRTTDGVGNP